MATVPTAGRRVNGVDVDALAEVVREVEQDPARAQVQFRVRSTWKGQTRSRTEIESYTIGGQEVHRHFTVDADEPFELLGRNTAPNPQELLLSALSACLTVGYVTAAAREGIALEKLEIETSATLDLRGFLCVDPALPPGYTALRYVVRVKGTGTPAQFEAIHARVAQLSPNYVNVARPVAIHARLLVE
jgi:organic hydroperoxide reductase OsmC/OhrA